MAGEFGRENMKAILERAFDRIDDALTKIEDTLGDLPYGMKRASDKAIVEMVEGNIAAYPVEEMILPDGTAYVESPWVLLVQMQVSEGNELLARYRRAKKKEMSSDLPYR